MVVCLISSRFRPPNQGSHRPLLQQVRLWSLPFQLRSQKKTSIWLHDKAKIWGHPKQEFGKGRRKRSWLVPDRAMDLFRKWRLWKTQKGKRENDLSWLVENVLEALQQRSLLNYWRYLKLDLHNPRSILQKHNALWLRLPSTLLLFVVLCSGCLMFRSLLNYWRYLKLDLHNLTSILQKHNALWLRLPSTLLLFVVLCSGCLMFWRQADLVSVALLRRLIEHFTLYRRTTSPLLSLPTPPH